jgi:hypothetical protein
VCHGSVIPAGFAAQNGTPPTCGHGLYLRLRGRAGDGDRTRIASLEGYVLHGRDLPKCRYLALSGREQAAGSCNAYASANLARIGDG